VHVTPARRLTLSRTGHKHRRHQNSKEYIIIYILTDIRLIVIIFICSRNTYAQENVYCHQRILYFLTSTINGLIYPLLSR